MQKVYHGVRTPPDSALIKWRMQAARDAALIARRGCVHVYYSHAITQHRRSLCVEGSAAES